MRLDPKSVSLTVGTSVTGLSILVNGFWRVDGWTEQFVAGRSVRVTAPISQTRSGVRYGFVRWSDGGDRSHLVHLGDTPFSLEAVYGEVG